MTITIARTDSPPAVIEPELIRTARTTGLLYLGFFIAGILGTMVVRGQLYVADDPQATLSNMLDHTSLARLGVALELAMVLAQALTAVWFYRLFRSIDTFAAGLLTAFGMVNAVAILGSAALLATAVNVADDPSLAVAGGAAATVQLLYVSSGHIWGVAALFFGLWLIPMGWLVIRSRWLPQALGWILIVAGVSYLVSPFVSYLFQSGDAIAQLLTIPSIIGELWIMGYLIIFGVRDHNTTASQD